MCWASLLRICAGALFGPKIIDHPTPPPPNDVDPVTGQIKTTLMRPTRRDMVAGLTSVAVAGALAPSALAQRPASPKPVIELFTSQGCSSCPQADALLAEYAERNDVFPLSYAVDYWDYLGWRDTLASPRFTKRQKAYASARGDGQVYTPQVVVNGLAHAIGSSRPAIEAAIATTEPQYSKSWVPIRMGVNADMLDIEVPAAANAGEATIWLLVVARRIEVNVKRGENSGRTLSYCNVVRDITPVGMWSGEAARVRVDRRAFVPSNADMLAVMLQRRSAGAILGFDVHRS
jgi:hypothetical protein